MSSTELAQLTQAVNQHTETTQEFLETADQRIKKLSSAGSSVVISRNMGDETFVQDQFYSLGGYASFGGSPQGEVFDLAHSTEFGLETLFVRKNGVYEITASIYALGKANPSRIHIESPLGTLMFVSLPIIPDAETRSNSNCVQLGANTPICFRVPVIWGDARIYSHHHHTEVTVKLLKEL